MSPANIQKCCLTLLVIICSYASFGQKKYKSFEVTVAGKGQPILMIPGATCSGDEWKETVARYQGRYQFHVFTLAGYAGVPPIDNGPYLETIKNDLKQYILENKLEKVILQGHSIGGFLAIWIASEMKDHLSKVIVVDALPFLAGTRNPNAKGGFDENMAKQMLDTYEKMDSAGMAANQLMVAKFMCNDSTRWPQIISWGEKSDKKTMAYTMTEMMGKDLREIIASIQAPVLVMGAYNPSPKFPGYTRDYATASYQQQYQACKTCVVHMTSTHAAHFIMYDAPQWYYQEMDAFLAAR